MGDELWKVVDAGRGVEEVGKDVEERVRRCVDDVGGKVVGRLWVNLEN